MQDLGISILLDGRNLIRLLEGLWVTVRIALLSVAISMALGVLLGMVMTLKNPITKALSRVY
ncbi:MAG: amino acid ABC transporter permease, partial [Faecalispora jeddahensis]